MAENEGAAAGPIMPGPDGTAEQWAIYFRDSAQGLQAQNAQLFAQLQATDTGHGNIEQDHIARVVL